jgi:hypothetical protein
MLTGKKPCCMTMDAIFCAENACTTVWKEVVQKVTSRIKLHLEGQSRDDRLKKYVTDDMLWKVQLKEHFESLTKASEAKIRAEIQQLQEEHQRLLAECKACEEKEEQKKQKKSKKDAERVKEQAEYDRAQEETRQALARMALLDSNPPNNSICILL